MAKEALFRCYAAIEECLAAAAEMEAQQAGVEADRPVGADNKVKTQPKASKAPCWDYYANYEPFPLTYIPGMTIEDVRQQRKEWQQLCEKNPGLAAKYAKPAAEQQTQSEQATAAAKHSHAVNESDSKAAPQHEQHVETKTLDVASRCSSAPSQYLEPACGSIGNNDCDVESSTHTSGEAADSSSYRDCDQPHNIPPQDMCMDIDVDGDKRDDAADSEVSMPSMASITYPTQFGSDSQTQQQMPSQAKRWCGMTQPPYVPTQQPDLSGKHMEEESIDENNADASYNGIEAPVISPQQQQQQHSDIAPLTAAEVAASSDVYAQELQAVLAGVHLYQPQQQQLQQQLSGRTVNPTATASTVAITASNQAAGDCDDVIVIDDTQDGSSVTVSDPPSQPVHVSAYAFQAKIAVMVQQLQLQQQQQQQQQPTKVG